MFRDYDAWFGNGESVLNDYQREMLYGETNINRLDASQQIPESFDISISQVHTDFKQEGASMSFVGICKCKDGLVAFGDSKSSKQDLLGGFFEDGVADRVKVFKGKSFLVTTYGLNQIMVLPRHPENLESVIGHMIECSEKYGDFLFKLHRYLHDIKEPDNYTFIIGAKEKTGFVIMQYSVSGSSITCGTTARDNVLCGGPLFYTDKAQLIDVRFSSLTVDEVKTALPQMIKEFIKEGDKVGNYNPVGGEIRIETLR